MDIITLIIVAGFVCVIAYTLTRFIFRAYFDERFGFLKKLSHYGEAKDGKD